jgi:mannose-6-phosphate isomerase-like protein (cupin superfamily)
MVQLRVLPVIAAAALLAVAADPGFLRRSIANVHPRADELTAGAPDVSYKPLFGVGDPDAGQLQTVVRYGELTLGRGASSATISYPSEEQIYFIVEGVGTLSYAGETAAVRANDFAYLLAGVPHGIANSGSQPLRAMVMGYGIPAGIQSALPAQLMLANADDVGRQVLGQHGPTTQFKLLMGLTTSKRDKLAAALVMNSLFLMEFAPGGTNIPHHHPNEEEIYLVLRGNGEMVAGKDSEGRERRYPASAGDVFFFRPGTEVGYYSKAREGQPHDLILAARSSLPSR